MQPVWSISPHSAIFLIILKSGSWPVDDPRHRRTLVTVIVYEIKWLTRTEQLEPPIHVDSFRLLATTSHVFVSIVE
jgi:hypothetical protein